MTISNEGLTLVDVLSKSLTEAEDIEAKLRATIKVQNEKLSALRARNADLEEALAALNGSTFSSNDDFTRKATALVASALAQSRQDAIAIARQYRQFFRAENFSDRERALRVGAATVIIDALSEGLEISPEQAEAEPSQPGD